MFCSEYKTSLNAGLLCFVVNTKQV